MSWQLAVFAVLALVLISGGVWFERSRPSARLLAAVAALAALGVAGRVALAPLPNVVATTDVALLAGYTLGGAPGFAVGSLSALISNFWLGQGPWTPWQMAGWGMVGVGGAALAMLTARRLGRWGLAAAAGLAGLLYGALLDLSAMVNFGGEQSLDRYLALSARGIPFNIAHALGNAALMLAAGPALVRMLSRYRERFEVRWSDAPAVGAGLAALVAALVVAAPLLASPPSLAAGAGASDRSSAGAAGGGAGRSWLQSAQNKDGGFGISAGASSSPGMTGWAILGLEAAGRNPRDVKRAGNSAIDYLRRNADQLTSTGDLERSILAVEGAGLDSRKFGGRDLLAELSGRESGSGSYEKQVNLTAFAVLARAAAGERGGALSGSASWLRDAQNKDGGWGSTAAAASEPDSTGAVLQALALTGASGPLGDGADWLAKEQHADGGWSLTEGGDSNAQSTAWALQGLAAARRDASGVAKGGKSGLDYLASRQRSDGHYAYSRASDQTPVWVTAQALTGVGPTPFPIAAVARQPGAGGGGNGSGGSGSGSGSGSGGGSSRSSDSGSGNGNSGPAAAGSQGKKSSGKSGKGKGGQSSGRGSRQGTGDKQGAEAGAPTGALASEPTPATPAPSGETGDGELSRAAMIGIGGSVLLLIVVGVIGQRRYWW